MTKKRLGFNDWKKKYYPVSANSLENATVLAALNHSIKKWKGLDGSILLKYGLRLFWGDIMMEDVFASPTLVLFRIASDTCALCIKFDIEEIDCRGCPLFEVRGQVRCDQLRPKEKQSPYYSMLTGNPKPMQEWLERAKQYYFKHKNKYAK